MITVNMDECPSRPVGEFATTPECAEDPAVNMQEQIGEGIVSWVGHDTKGQELAPSQTESVSSRRID